MANQMIGFRATPERREKLLALAQGESVTVTEVINRLIDGAEVKPTQRVTAGLVLVSKSSMQKNTHRDAKALTGQSITVGGKV